MSVTCAERKATHLLSEAMFVKVTAFVNASLANGGMPQIDIGVPGLEFLQTEQGV